MNGVDAVRLKVVLQRVSSAELTIPTAGIPYSKGCFGEGLVVLFGVGVHEESQRELLTPELAPQLLPQIDKCIEKILALRIFEDAEGKMNKSLIDVKGGIYWISQFTLFADVRKGNRPSFSLAAPAAFAKTVYELSLERLKQRGQQAEIMVLSGEFGAEMHVSLVNNGPVTIAFEYPYVD